jgi:cell division septal protein FtsQ
MISEQIHAKKASKKPGQRAVRGLAWLMAGFCVKSGGMGWFLVVKIALIEVEVII